MAHLGIAHNQVHYDQLYTRPAWTKLLITRNINMPTFAQAVDKDALDRIVIISMMGVCGKGLDRDLGWRVAMAECCLPHIPNTDFKDQAEARKSFKGRVINFLENTNHMNAICSFAGVADRVVSLKQGSDPEINFTVLPILVGEALHLQGLDYDKFIPLFRRICHHALPDLKHQSLKLIVMSHVALIKQGNATNQYIDKIVAEVTESTGLDIELDIDVMKSVHSEYMKNLTPDQVRDTATAWRNMIPMTFMRARMVLDRGAGHNLICFSTVKRALRTYPGFPWTALAQLIGLPELANFEAAEVAIADNPYYGYRSDLGPAKSTLYKNFATACSLLIAKAEGDKMIRKALCFKKPNQIPNSVEVIDLIDAYILSQAAAAVAGDPAVDARFAALRAKLATQVNIV